MLFRSRVFRPLQAQSVIILARVGTVEGEGSKVFRMTRSMPHLHLATVSDCKVPSEGEGEGGRGEEGEGGREEERNGG